MMKKKPISISHWCIFNRPAVFLNTRYSLLTVFIFAFCTSAWSTGSRALWQHGPSMLMLSAALYLILSAREKPHYNSIRQFTLGIFIFNPSDK